MTYRWNYSTLSDYQKNKKDELAKELNLNPVLAELLINKGIETKEEAMKFLYPSLDDLHDPFLLPDMDKAIRRIEKALGEKERILIYGDYDVDGTTAVALVYKFFRGITNNIDYYIPGSGVSWMMLAVGAVIAILVNWLGVSPLAFALGMFIPIQLNTPLIVGGLLNHMINKKGKDPKLTNARHQRAILISSGFIAGAALFGVIGALIIFITGNSNALNFGLWNDPDGVGAQIAALVAFTALVIYFVWESKRAKVE